MSAEGTKGGAVNRPASLPEIKKLPRYQCRDCGLEGPAPIVIGKQCGNRAACERRQRQRAKGAGTKP